MANRDPIGRLPAEPQWVIDVERYQHKNGKVRYVAIREKGRDREEWTKYSGWKENLFDIYPRRYYLTAKAARRAGERRRLKGQSKWTRVG